MNAARTDSTGKTTDSHIQPVVNYHPLLVAMHWLMAVLLVIALAGASRVLVKIPNSDPMKIQGLRQHFAGGILLLTLMVIRLVVRVRTAHPARAFTGNPFLDRLAWLSHRLLYVLVFGQAGSGLVLALQAGLPGILFSGHGALPPDFWVFPVRSVHYVISRMLMAVIALHVAAALYHAFFLRDGLLQRMSLGKRFAPSLDSVTPARSRSVSQGEHHPRPTGWDNMDSNHD
jgi:cytochrome b561